jgi:hypothetical protein
LPQERPMGANQPAIPAILALKSIAPMGRSYSISHASLRVPKFQLSSLYTSLFVKRQKNPERVHLKTAVGTQKSRSC